MCTADTGLFGQVWLEGPRPFIDFNTIHKCRNFESIRAWTESHQMPDFDTEYIALPQPGDKLLPGIP